MTYLDSQKFLQGVVEKGNLLPNAYNITRVLFIYLFILMRARSMIYTMFYQNSLLQEILS